MKKVAALFEKSGKTMDALGQDMGYSPAVARKAVWQFLKTKDPRVSMLRKFAAAMGIDLRELFNEKGTGNGTKDTGPKSRADSEAKAGRGKGGTDKKAASGG